MTTTIVSKKINQVSRDVFQNNLFSAGMSRFGDTPTQEVPVHDLQIKKTIGSGGFGVVFSAVDPTTDQFFAIKKIKYQLSDPTSENCAKKELEFAKRLKHRNIAKVFGTYTSKNSAYIVMGLCETGNLKRFIKINFPLDISLLKSFTIDMASAVKYLHVQKIAHQDIKSRNFLLDENLTIKLCDFGLTGNCTGRTYNRRGTRQYFSPQIALENSHPLKSDIWALGITFFEMATSHLPDEHKLITRMARRKEIKFKIICPSFVHNDLADLIENMLAYSEYYRFNIYQVTNHRWLNNKSKTSKTQVKHKEVGHTRTNAISSLGEFDYFCETSQSKRSVFIDIKLKFSLVITLLSEIFENQQINYVVYEKKISCMAEDDSKLSFLVGIEDHFLNKNISTVKFLKLTGPQNDFLSILRVIFELVFSNN